MPVDQESAGSVFPTSQLRTRRERSGELYLEFLRIPEMSVGFYALPAGGVDPQTPHREDEVYNVLRGRASISIAGRDWPVGPGATIFVPKGVEHRFHSITEALELLVVFAPAESLEPDSSPVRPPSAASGSRGAEKVS
jgi:mannose-6-phosphate isomerase-like protein (cupin superfamily)